MLKTILSALALCLGCLMFTGCSDDNDLGSVEDYGGEREVAPEDRVSPPGGTKPDEDEFAQQEQGPGGGG